MNLKTAATLAPLAPVAMLMVMLAVFLAVTGCANTPHVREVTVTKEVPVPYHEPCPKASDKPAVPKSVHEEHPVMPADPAQPDGVDWRAVSRILGAKVLELFGYADKADGIMTACSKP